MMVYLITGKPNSGKTTYANRLAEELRADGKNVVVIDGDEWRKQNKNYDFTDNGILRNLMGAALKASNLEREGKIIILAFVAPKWVFRVQMRRLWKESMTIYIPGGEMKKDTVYQRPDLRELRQTR